MNRFSKSRVLLSATAAVLLLTLLGTPWGTGVFQGDQDLRPPVSMPVLLDSKPSSPCVPGKVIPGSYIVKHRKAKGASVLSNRQWKALKESRKSTWHVSKAQVLDALDADMELIETADRPTEGASSEVKAEAVEGFLPLGLQRALESGELEYVEPNRTVCFDEAPANAGYRISGKVRVLGNSAPAYPGTLLVGNEQSIFTLSPRGENQVIKLENLGDSNGRYPYKFTFWDPGDSGINNVLATIAAGRRICVPVLGCPYNWSFEPWMFGGYRDGKFFKQTKGYFTDTEMGSHVITDLYGTGERDILMVQGGGSQRVKLYAVRPTGGEPKPELIFTAQSDESYFHSFVDFNYDGAIDLVTEKAESDSGSLSYTYKVYLQTPPASFTLGTTYSFVASGCVGSWACGSSIFVDANNDGLIDLMRTKYQMNHPGDFEIHTNNGDNTWQVSSWYYSDEQNQRLPIGSIIPADLNGDGINDWIVQSRYSVPNGYAGGAPDCAKNKFLIYINRRQYFPTNGCISNLKIRDVNGDGKKDIVYSVGMEVFGLINATTDAGQDFQQGKIISLNGLPQAPVDPYDDDWSPHLTSLDFLDMHAISNVLIVFSGSDGKVYQARTDAQGEFEFKNLPADTYTVGALRPGFKVVSEFGGKIKVDRNRTDANFQGLVIPAGEPNVQLPAGAPNDPGLSAQWALYNAGQQGGTAGLDIGAIDAWKATTGSRDVVVGILDSGIDYNHPDLIENLWINKGEVAGNGADDDVNGVVDDIFGYHSGKDSGDPFVDVAHGTHVAGIIGAKGNNGIGVSGINQNVQILMVNVTTATGGTSDANVIKGIDYLAKMKSRGVNIRVVNASLGATGSRQCSQAYADAIGKLRDLNILFVAAAGNGDDKGVGIDIDASPMPPASCPVDNILAVANLTRNGELSGDSNFGAKTVMLAAPGSQILNTFPDGRYESISGTSMATPYVAGVAALVLSREPNLSFKDLKNRLVSTVKVLPSLQGKVASSGFVNAAAALGLGGGGGTPPGGGGGGTDGGNPGNGGSSPDGGSTVDSAVNWLTSALNQAQKTFKLIKKGRKASKEEKTFSALLRKRAVFEPVISARFAPNKSKTGLKDFRKSLGDLKTAVSASYYKKNKSKALTKFNTATKALKKILATVRAGPEGPKRFATFLL